MSLFGRSKPLPNTGPDVREHYTQLMERGYAHIRGGFAPDLVTKTLHGIKELFRHNALIFDRHKDAQGHYPRIVNLHALHKPLLDLFATNPIALAVQDAFLGGRSTVYTSLYFERGSAQTIHRDTPYFTTRPEYKYLGVWVALEDADTSNGCLEVVPGGHLVEEFDREALALRHYPSLDDVPPDSEPLWAAYQGMVMEACSRRGLVTQRLIAKAGDVVIWHPQLPHGGSPIEDASRSRHSMVMHVTAEGTPVYQQNVFFNPGKSVPERARWKFASYKGRKYVDGDFIDIGGVERHSLADFV
jgi:phytanoyl-CoA hydroxylase